MNRPRKKSSTSTADYIVKVLNTLLHSKGDRRKTVSCLPYEHSKKVWADILEKTTRNEKGPTSVTIRAEDIYYSSHFSGKKPKLTVIKYFPNWYVTKESFIPNLQEAVQYCLRLF